MMEHQKQIEQNKVKLEILRHGQRYKFERKELNEDLEPTGNLTAVSSVSGLFHVSKSYLSERRTEGTAIRSKGQPMLLLLWEESESILFGDVVNINGKQYKVTGKNNIEEYNILCDVSLEVVLDGDHTL